MSPTAQQVITASHAISVRATASTAVLGVIPNLPVSGGSVTADATSQVRRTASVTIADTTLWPGSPNDILSPLGSEMLIEYGVSIPGVGTEWIPLITGVITGVDRTLPAGAGLTVTLADRSSKVAEDEFVSPTQIGGGSTTYVQALTGLVQHLYPNVVVIDKTGNSTVCPVLEINKDRWADGVEQICTAIAAEAFFDQQGRLVIRNQPTINDSIVWQASVGVGGVIVTKQDSQKRELVYNTVIASGMRTDGTSPVYAVVQDTDPTSPTYYLGPFGAKTRRYSSALLTTLPQATAAAQALLDRCRGEQASVSLTTITNPALEPGDVFKIRTPSASTLYVIDKVTTPLTPTETQQITCRSKVLPPEG